MRKFSIITLLLLLFLLLALPVSVLAGGWAVVTLDSLPQAPNAGEPLSIGFTVRQHGISPVRDGQFLVRARNVESGESLDVFAHPEGEVGHYQVEIVFPSPGTWSWEVETQFYPGRQPMPDLTVLQGAGGQAPTAASRPIWPAALILGAVLLIGVWIWRMEKRPLRLALALAGVAGLLILGGLFAAGQRAASAREEQTMNAQAELGRDLFTAKGCVICHTNTRAAVDTRNLSTGAGPDLSAYHNDQEFLQRWLKDPTDVRPQAGMPDLGLSEEEIEALIAFINSDAP